MNLNIVMDSPAFALSEAELATLPQHQLQSFDSELNRAIAALGTMRDRLDGALARRYGEAARHARLSAGKDFGVIHLDDGPLRVTADLPKKVSWDQEQLGDLVERIRAAGENPAEYVETVFRVSETRYLAWPEHIRSHFAPARTVKPGKASFRLALTAGGER